jgi:tripartite-type tricarboxylate transporter receptor subunit TctC
MERDHYERYLMNVMLTARLLPLLLTVVCLPAALAEYPDHPIRYIVPSAAGNGADISARMLTAELANQMKAQFVIDNRPTAGGVIGVGMLARAPADGYTLGYANMVYLSIFPALMSNLPYDIDREIQVVGRFTSGQNLLAVRNTLPVKTVADLVNYARANPDKLTFGSSGNGTTLHLSGELFKQMTGTRIVHVPYKAVQQALTEIIAGQVDLIFDNQPSIAPYAKAGRVRGLAVTGPSRSALFPELPTMQEAGVTGYEITTWTGMMAPAGVPKEIIARLNAEIAKVCASPAFQAKVAATGSVCATGSTEEFVEFTKRERVTWGDIVRRSNAKID